MSGQRGNIRHRSSSFFDLEEAKLHVLEKHATPSLKGKFAVTHEEIPVHSRSSLSEEVDAMKKRTGKSFQNTFQVDPPSLFNPSKVKHILEKELKFLENVDYEPEQARHTAIDLANSIKSQVKSLFPRYKTVVQVTIGGKGSQGIKVVSKFFWDQERDNYASHTVTSSSIFAVATVYGLYHD